MSYSIPPPLLPAEDLNSFPFVYYKPHESFETGRFHACVCGMMYEGIKSDINYHLLAANLELN